MVALDVEIRENKKYCLLSLLSRIALCFYLFNYLLPYILSVLNTHIEKKICLRISGCWSHFAFDSFFPKSIMFRSSCENRYFSKQKNENSETFYIQFIIWNRNVLCPSGWFCSFSSVLSLERELKGSICEEKICLGFIHSYVNSEFVLL